MQNPESAGDDSVVTVLAAFAQEGWTENHLVCADGAVECGACGETTGADALEVAAQHRVEGASDPDDMQIVLGFPCPHCGAKGVVVAAFGPAASEHDADFMARVDVSAVADPLAAG